MFRKFGLMLFAVMMVMALVPAGADAGNGNGRGKSDDGTTAVPGQAGRDGYVTGHYTSVYAYDAAGDYYWDLGDGRVQSTVDSIDALDGDTLTVCEYINNYRADFGDDPYMDAGWIINNIHCFGYDGNSTYTYLIVHESDPRFTGTGLDVGWGSEWEAYVLTESGSGNLARPMKEPGNLAN